MSRIKHGSHRFLVDAESCELFARQHVLMSGHTHGEHIGCIVPINFTEYHLHPNEKRVPYQRGRRLRR